MTAISDKYTQLGGAAGFLGTAVGREVAAANGGLKQEFQNGTIYWHARTGAFEVHGMIRARWLALGGDASPFGYPISDETTAADGVGKYNHFEHASVYWHPSTGAYEVHGLIRERWRTMGAELSLLGYPLSNESTTPDGIGRYNHFQKGSIYWTPATGAHEVHGPIRERWAELRWERGVLGYPISAPYDELRNRIPYIVARFEHGKIEYNVSTQQVHVEKFPSAALINYSVPLVAYQVSDNDGGRSCAITADGARQWVDEANRVFATAGVRFTYDGLLREMRDTEVNNLPAGDVESLPNWPAIKARLDALAAQHRSVVVIYRFGPGAYSVGGGWSWSNMDFVAMSFFDPNALSVLPHELGHHFGLPHTHGRSFTTVREATDYILSGGAIDELDGDRTLIDDTPPDPYIVELGAAVDIHAIPLGSQAFTLARRNIMSYWNHGGTGRLTHSQIMRIRQIVQERRNRYLNVTDILPVDCPTLMQEIALRQRRLGELVAERDAETDPLKRRRLTNAISRLRSQIRSRQTRAQLGGCV
jgi:hypothetical protein